MSELLVLPLLPLSLALLAVFVASVVQTSSGIGFGMVAAPILILIDPILVPGPVLFLSLLVSALAAWREWNSVDFRGLAVALTGRIPGTVLAGLTLSLVPVDLFGLIFGVLVLMAVLISAVAGKIAPTSRVLLPAGFVSGYMGTITSIGAPPMALAYQYGSPAKIRSTMAVYFVVGAAFSIATLAWFGRFGQEQLVASIIFLPPLVAGFLVSNYVVRHLDGHRIRQILLGLCAIASLILIIRSIMGL